MNKRTKGIVEKHNVKDGKELTSLYFTDDGLILTDLLQKLIDTCKPPYGINQLHC